MKIRSLLYNAKFCFFLIHRRHDYRPRERRESGNGSDGESLAGDSDALNVKERARQLQRLLLRSEMHAPRLTGTYGRRLVIHGDPISGSVCAIGNYYTDDLSLLRSTYTHIMSVREGHACTRTRYARLPVSLHISHSLSLSLTASRSSSFQSLILFPFPRFSFLLFLLLPRRPPAVSRLTNEQHSGYVKGIMLWGSNLLY